MSTTMNALEVAILGNVSKAEGFDYVFENVQSVADLKACAALPDEELAHMFKGGTVEAVQRLRGREYMQIAYWYDKHRGQYYWSSDVENVYVNEIPDGVCHLLTVGHNIGNDGAIDIISNDGSAPHGTPKSVTIDGVEANILDDRIITLPASDMIGASVKVPTVPFENMHVEPLDWAETCYIYHNCCHNNLRGSDDDVSHRGSVYATEDDMWAYIYLRHMAGDLAAYNIEAILLTSGILPARPKIIFESLMHYEHESDTWNGIENNCELGDYLQQSIQPVADQWIATNKQWKQESQAYEVNEVLRDFFYFDDLDDYIARYDVAALRDARMTCNILH